MRAALGRAIMLLGAVLLVGGIYALLSNSGEPDRRGDDHERRAFIGTSLTALNFEDDNNANAGRAWTPYSGGDAPAGGFIGAMKPGIDRLTATVKLDEPLKAANYQASVKAIDYDHHMAVTLSAGGGEAKLTTDDRDDNGYWTRSEPMRVDESGELTITLARQPDTPPGPARLLLMGIYLTTDAGETLRADDQVVDLTYPTQRDGSSPRPGNLIRNGSFETGVGHGWGYTNGRAFSVVSTWDPKTAHDGSASLRMPLEPSIYNKAVIGLESSAYAVAPNKRHTLSLWARTDAGNTAAATVSLVNSYDPSTDGALPDGQPAQPKIAKAVEVGEAWTRIDVTGDLLAYPKAEYSVAVVAKTQRGKHLWIDGVSLNEGGPAPYAPRAALQVGLTSSQPSNVFYEDEPQRMRLRVSNETAAGRDAVVRYEVFDERNRRVTSGKRAVRVAAHSTAGRTLDVATGRRGPFRIVLWADGLDGSEEEVLYGVVPRPQRAGADSTSTIGTHSNFLGFTNAAMRKLGIKWDRALSPAGFFRWADVEPADDEFVWFDEPVARAKRQGVRTLGVIGTNNYWPKWADRNGLPDLDKWEEFVAQSARHYRGDVSGWELWNEPLRVFKADFYAKMLKRGAEAVRRSDPKAMVVGMAGAASPAEVKLVVDELEKQFPDWPWRDFVDVLSIHMYPTGEAVEQGGAGQSASYRRQVVQAYDKPTWNTETGTWDRGYFHTDNAPVASWGHQLQPYKSAAQFTDASQLAVERLTRNFIESVGDGLSKFFYYDMRVILSPTYVDSHPTMLEYDDSIRPKGIAFAVLAKLFDHATGLGRVSVGDKATRAFTFRRGDSGLLAVYAGDGKRRAMKLPGIASRRLVVVDSMGNRIPRSRRGIVYGRRPVYVSVAGVGAERLRAAVKRARPVRVPDETAPNVTIDRAPRGPVPGRPLTVRFSAADDNDTLSAVQPRAVVYSHRLTGPGDDGAWSPWSVVNTVQLGTLQRGRHVFSVRARDRSKNTSAIVSRTIVVTSEK